MKLTSRQLEIIKIVKENEPISGDSIAKTLGLSRATLRSDLAILTMTGLLDARPKVGYFYTGQTIEPLLYEKLYKKTVEDIMLPPILIHQSTTVYDAVTNLFMYDVGSLYVKDDNDELNGILSRKDLLRAAISNPNTEKTPVAMIMSRMPNIITITRDRTILEAGGLLMQHSIDTLPVVEINQPKKVIGKVTKTRMMAYFINAGNDIEKENY
ncbi:helix-turn-helix transcriptional regulator [Candidatus Enterococcus ikei]|uniref:Helix-turn-helix transcriptional regulator n=1 Tax=Candidatus Enterococcus ikei TaxID=2815326 RepID=A0ABS3GVY8_9ENTE|nr:helix-turn-helix transcriptional regulator [Enterococcus sp. DIV0869a]MBO0439423.1 helix-turn-helix transcriptional regulator [Enterococcus sp. DIV0869a]